MTDGSAASVSAGSAQSAAARYLGKAMEVIGEIVAVELPAIRAAAELCARAVAGGGLIHVLGTGHSHILAEELFYRAGGLANVNPILDERLMLHRGAIASTSHERSAETGKELLAVAGFAAGDVLIVASNSGGNAVTVTVADGARRAGVGVVAVVSRAHAAVGDGVEPGGLLDVADLVIDNHGAVGDASTDVAGVPRPVGPTSTVAGAAIVNAVAAETAQLLAARGAPVAVLASSNVAGGVDYNRGVLAPLRDRIALL